MAANPLITFKAGKCTFSGKKVTPVPTPGYLYLYFEDDMPHFCWRPRSQPASHPEIDLFMVPGDGSFEPVPREYGAEELHSPTNGRIYTLKFQSSSQKHFFWMQSKSQHAEGTPSWFSQRDQRLGQIVNSILQGEELDMEAEVADLRNGGGGGGADGDGDDEMDVDEHPPEHGRHPSTGGAGQGATGADPREEGSASREGGGDGARALSSQPSSQDPSAVVQNFLKSLQGSSQNTPPPPPSGADKPYTTLSDLLTPSQTIPYISTTTPAQLDNLCAFLPPELFTLSQESSSTPDHATHTSAADASAAIDALSTEQKREILVRVLRSPQLQQSLGSLTVALRDGGLPIVSEALGLKVKNGGNVRHASVPLGGGEAVEAFVDGVRTTVEEEKKSKS
ncbi:hypothetical protein B0A48_15206 [Cryoendolithus antarcticus]|uniref:Pru domain-containing protein n=1 Tax=Cryoendolithus antarcticus TaxID=1507870 RepID=A0A1V8SIS5_9PEZI|nr:hypothetical protein B0A48_15206 [Cryoendolithus antarcticus]